MSIIDFIETINDCENIVFSLFNCASENVVEFETETGVKTEINIDELSWSEYVDLEIGSMDMWLDKGKIHIELNVEIDEEEDDE